MRRGSYPPRRARMQRIMSFARGYDPLWGCAGTCEALGAEEGRRVTVKICMVGRQLPAMLNVKASADSVPSSGLEDKAGLRPCASKPQRSGCFAFPTASHLLWNNPLRRIQASSPPEFIEEERISRQDPSVPVLRPRSYVLVKEMSHPAQFQNPAPHALLLHRRLQHDRILHGRDLVLITMYEERRRGVSSATELRERTNGLDTFWWRSGQEGSGRGGRGGPLFAAGDVVQEEGKDGRFREDG